MRFTSNSARRNLLGVLLHGLGAALVAAIGWCFIEYSIGQGFQRLSYDLTFALKERQAVPICIVYMDENAGRALEQRFGIWDRRIHANLIRRVTEDGAKGIFLDLVFADASADPAADDLLAEAMKESGRVYIGAALEVDVTQGAEVERVVPPTAALRRAAAGWGLLAFRLMDADYGVRYLYAGTDRVPVLAWRMAEKLGAPLPSEARERAAPRWMNYYGPSGSFEQVGYERVLAPDGLPPGFFRDKVVFVGGRSAIGTLGLGKDDFRQPHTRWTRRFAPGVEVHAHAFVNLWRGEWLERWELHKEDALVIGYGLLLGLGLPLLRPFFAISAAILAAGCLAAWAMWMTWEHRVWTSWCVPVLLQTPLALGWAISVRYLSEERRRKALKKAFAHYLSPQMAERIADSKVDLRLGGQLVETTIMFTDLAGFTTLSEHLEDPARVGDVLTGYFTDTTGHVLDNNGTIIKYIGDAVLAVWGAPLADANHAKSAVRAGWEIFKTEIQEIEGHRMITRIGIHTGTVLAGNLGSPFRFDYTVIGDAVNLASRIEALNKQFGTCVLISSATASKLGDEFRLRGLGKFIAKGKRKPVELLEVLGPDGGPSEPWAKAFAEALAAFQRGDFSKAEKLFIETKSLRGGEDGPSDFYLKCVAECAGRPVPPGWEGEVELSDK
jgi:adenylate cyclase